MNDQFDINVHIRWMIRRDMPEVLDIEKSSFELPWSEEDFIRCLRQRNCIGMVAEYDEQVIGFMVYELHRDKLHVLNLSVHPDWRRCEVGAQMVARLVNKLSQQRRNKIVLEVRESNLPAQQFFAAMGFRVVSTLRNYYEDTPETNDDAYVFVYRFRVDKPKELEPQNRISRHVK